MYSIIIERYRTATDGYDWATKRELWSHDITVTENNPDYLNIQVINGQNRH